MQDERALPRYAAPDDGAKRREERKSGLGKGHEILDQGSSNFIC